MTPKQIIEKMMSVDNMSQWLGIEVLNFDPGSVSVRMTVRAEMVNGFGVAHGGITYSLADSTLAFSSNSHGMRAMSIETSISHLKSVNVDDVLTAKTTQLSLTRKTGSYAINITSQNNELVAHFKGTVYRSDKVWD